MNTLAVDVGGTSTRVAIVSPNGTILAHSVFSTPPRGAPAALKPALFTAVSSLLAQSAAEDLLATAGVALPGIRDERNQIVRAVNLPDLQGIDAGDFFAGALGRAVVIESDANAAALAQWRALERGGQASRRFVSLSFGTGVGGGVILNGAILRHTRGGAGHFGHIPVDCSPTALRCACGGVGCVETVARELARCAARPSIDEERRRAIGGIVHGLLTIAVIYSPDRIALGGGLLDHHPALLDELGRAFDARRTSLLPADLAIVRSPLRSDEAGVIGAAELASGRT